MKIKILKIEPNELVDAEIIEGKNRKLPSIHEGWRFNFSKHSKQKGVQSYILITEENPSIIEGCLIYKMKNDIEPYMAYIEIAPQNKGKNKKYDLVAEKNQIKLMALYCKKYNAQRLGETTMIISPENGEIIIEKYLDK